MRDRLAHFLWELSRVFWPLLTCLLVLWWFETLRLRYDGADWLRTLAKLNHVALGVIAAHVSWSTLFPYLDMRGLLRSYPAQFRATILARAIYYGAVVLALALGL